jgi:COP9 signalosome complex subunit 5
MKRSSAGAQRLQASNARIAHACRVRVSALALLKMAMHAKSGGNLEIMGMLYGSVKDDTFIVIDAFALPVEGTETRVNAQAEAYEYMVDFAETNKVSRVRPVACLDL